MHCSTGKLFNKRRKERHRCSEKAALSRLLSDNALIKIDLVLRGASLKKDDVNREKHPH